MHNESFIAGLLVGQNNSTGGKKYKVGDVLDKTVLKLELGQEVWKKLISSLTGDVNTNYSIRTHLASSSDKVYCFIRGFGLFAITKDGIIETLDVDVEHPYSNLYASYALFHKNNYLYYTTQRLSQEYVGCLEPVIRRFNVSDSTYDDILITATIGFYKFLEGSIMDDNLNIYFLKKIRWDDRTKSDIYKICKYTYGSSGYTVFLNFELSYSSIPTLYCDSFNNVYFRVDTGGYFGTSTIYKYSNEGLLLLTIVSDTPLGGSGIFVDRDENVYTYIGSKFCKIDKNGNIVKIFVNKNNLGTENENEFPGSIQHIDNDNGLIYACRPSSKEYHPVTVVDLKTFEIILEIDLYDRAWKAHVGEDGSIYVLYAYEAFLVKFKPIGYKVLS